MAEANNAFALDLYRALAAARKEGNLMVSPYSVGVALGMTRLGAAGETAQEIDTVFHWDADARERHAALAAALAPEPRRPDARRPEPLYELQIANRLFGQKGLPFEQEFLNGAAKWFDGAFEVVDFTRSAAARERINGWVAEQTKDRIQDIIQPPLPEPNTAMALANAVYFKGTWATPFPERATRPAPFHTGPDAVDDVATMHTKGMFGYVRGDGFQGLELPYHGGASLLVLVPTGEHTLDVFSKWGAAEWAAATGALAPTVADVALPKFEFASDFELGETLEGLECPRRSR